MARKRRFRFDFPDVFAGRLFVLQGRRWLIANSFAAVAGIGALGSELSGIAMSREIALHEKARDRFPGAGSIVAMVQICR